VIDSKSFATYQNKILLLHSTMQAKPTSPSTAAPPSLSPPDSAPQGVAAKRKAGAHEGAHQRCYFHAVQLPLRDLTGAGVIDVAQQARASSLGPLHCSTIVIHGPRPWRPHGSDYKRPTRKPAQSTPSFRQARAEPIFSACATNEPAQAEPIWSLLKAGSHRWLVSSLMDKSMSP
jgi:hypothetical protein